MFLVTFCGVQPSFRIDLIGIMLDDIFYLITLSERKKGLTTKRVVAYKRPTTIGQT